MQRHNISAFYKLFRILLVLLIPCLSVSQSDKKINPDTVKVLTYNIKGKTASGKKTSSIKGKFIAVSPDLLNQFPLYSYVILSECKWKGVYRVMDIMAKKNVKTIDIYYTGKKHHDQVKCACALK